MSDQTSSVVAKSTWRDMPPGIPYIVGNEAAERFSFYGMKAILFVYMTKYLLDQTGHRQEPMNPSDAKAALHWFVASAYFFPLIGAILSDWLLGKYRTIFWLSQMYCFGHLALAVLPGRLGLLCGLTLIAVGAGGIKPCVSAHVGDQFTEKNQDLLSRVFGWYYFSINFGAFFSTILTPILLRDYGPHVAFGLPGVLMLIATIVFWLGRNKFVHVKPGGTAFIRETFSLDGLKALARLIPLYLFVSIFWSLYDQTASAWVEQADAMNRVFLGLEWLPSQIQAVNPVLVLVLIPACTYLFYPAINSFFPLTPLRKVAIGFFFTAFSFGISAGIETQITGGQQIRNAAVERSDNERELIVRLREHRAWNIKTINWQQAEVGSTGSKSATESPTVPLNIRVEVGDSPRGDWVEKAAYFFDILAVEPHVIELPDGVSAKYVRLAIKTLPVSNGSDASKSVDWNAPQIINVVAAESSPPIGADSRAAAVWPDVAAMGYKPNVFWQLVAYFFLTLSEVMVSITCLEFSYTQSPNKMKSLVMSLYLLSVSLGNALTATVNGYIQNADGTSKLPGASYYWFFTGLMFVAALGFLIFVATYREKTYIQSRADAE